MFLGEITLCSSQTPAGAAPQGFIPAAGQSLPAAADHVWFERSRGLGPGDGRS